MKERVVVPEILDSLSPDDPRVQKNRRDLRYINFFMGNWRWIARRLKQHMQSGQWIVEAGAGEGDLARYLGTKLPAIHSARYTGLDRVPAPEGWPAEDWIEEDFLQWKPNGQKLPDVLIVNLLLHQFKDEELAVLAERLRDIPLWIFCEPRRSAHGLVGLSLLRPLGLCDVSWHDGRVSVRAGFRGEELATHLRARQNGRTYRISTDFRGGYRMVSWAEKKQ